MSKTNTSYFAFIQLLPLTSHALLIIVMFIFTKFILPWVPEVFLACSGNFQCSLKADTSIDRDAVLLDSTPENFPNRSDKLNCLNEV